MTMRRVPAILMVIFLVFPLFYTALTVLSVSTWALNRGFYAELLGNAALYEIPDAVSSATWTDADVLGIDFRVSGRALREVAPPAYLRDQAVRVMGQVFDVLEGRAMSDQISVDLAPLKAALQGDAGRRFAAALAKDLPVGGTELSVRPGHLPRSRPASIPVDKAAQVIAQGLPGFARSLPDTARLAETVTHWGWYWRPPVSIPGIVATAGIFILLVAAGFCVAAAFVGGATRFERLQWAGWSLFAPGVAVLLLGLLVLVGYWASAAYWWASPSWSTMLGRSPGFAAAVADTARHLISRIATGFLAAGAIAAGAAMGLLAWSWSIPVAERRGPDA
jgi:hypothetical protein